MTAIVTGAPAAERRRRGPGRLLHLALAVTAFAPLLWNRPGWISGDTKAALFTDPGRVLSEAWSMWDPSVGLGTVPHQNIGFLWPMGPFFWVADAAGIPDWVAQRLWWGTIVFAAGAGVVHLLRTFGWSGPAVAAAAFTYAWTPYLLGLLARLSVLLLPFAALPWLLAFTIRASRTSGWRYPALFALTVATCGSGNASSLVLVGVAPLLWLAYSALAAREVPLRRALCTAGRLAALTVPVSAWWIAGLSVQATNGLNILQFSETAETVARVSTAHEILRGLGNWFFYGEDRLGPWIEASVPYMTSPALLATTYLVPIAGLAAAALVRWRHRSFFVLLAAVGTVLAVGAHPWAGGPIASRAIRWFLLTETGAALRNLPRAAPLVALSVAVLLGAGVHALLLRRPRWARPALLVVLLVPLLTLPAPWVGDVVPERLRWKEIPRHWVEAAADVEAGGDETRVLVLPGADFAAYRWGNTVDPLLPLLTDRPSAQRHLLPQGSAASLDLLDALEQRIQERTVDPASLAPVARLLRAGDIVVQGDLQYERYNSPRPKSFWALVASAPGLEHPTGYGPRAPNRTDPGLQLDDETAILGDAALPDAPEVGVVAVGDPVPIVSTHPVERPLVVAGDGAGLVDAAAAGLIAGTELVRYSAGLGDGELVAALDAGALLLLTDTNRKQGQRWSSIRHTKGYTEPVGVGVLTDDASDSRLDLFPDAGADTQTVALQRGGLTAVATSYGNRATFTPEDRAAHAADGDPRTAWRTAAFADARGERIELRMDESLSLDRVTLVQAPAGPEQRTITKVRLHFGGGGGEVEVGLGPESLRPPGQVVAFPARSTDIVGVEILGTSDQGHRSTDASSVGFAEIGIGDGRLRLDEAVRLPTDLLSGAGRRSIEHALAIVLSRLRQDPADVTRGDEERSLARVFELPTGRRFSVSGTARLSARAGEAAVDGLLGRPHGLGPTAQASTWLAGSVERGSAAFDGDPGTAWHSVRGAPRDQWVEMRLATPATTDRFRVTLLADPLHSVPTRVRVDVDGATVGEVAVPPVETSARPGARATVDLALPAAVTGTAFRLTVTDVREVTSQDWVSGSAVAQPVGLAEIAGLGAGVAPRPAVFDSGCRSDLLHVDGAPVPVRVSGSMSDAIARKPLPVVACGEAGLALGPGEHEVRTALGEELGIDLDQLVLRSAAGGGASGVTGLLDDAAAHEPAAPSVEVVAEAPDEVSVDVTGAAPGEPFWLVLGQSFNDGWTASVDGRPLGAPQLIDGFANGWQITPEAASFAVTIRFGPQRRVDAALAVSAAAALLCLVLLARRPRTAVEAPPTAPGTRACRGAATAPQAVLAAVALGVAAVFLAGPLVGVAVGTAAGVGARWPRARRPLAVGGPLALAAAAASVLYVQVADEPAPGPDWPLEVASAHHLAWLAILLLAADVVVERVWRQPRVEENGRTCAPQREAT